MELSGEAVIAASNSWIWVPDNATAAETDEYLIVRFPDYFDHPLEVIRFTPAGPVADAVETVLDRARDTACQSCGGWCGWTARPEHQNC